MNVSAFKAACVQLNSGSDLAENLRAIAASVREAAAQGAQLIMPSTRHVSDTAVPRLAKQRSRLNWWIATSEAGAEG